MNHASLWCALIAVVTACGPDPREVEPDAAPCPDGERRCEGNTFEVCSKGDWTVVDQCPLNCSLEGCTSCTGPDCVTDACAQASSDQSNLGCEYWAVDLDNATEVVGSPIPNPGMECSFWPGTKVLAATAVCTDGLGQVAGMCDDPNVTCPPGYSCQVPAAGVCAADADHAPFAVVVSNPQAVTVAVTIVNASGHTMTVPVGPGEIAALYPQQLGFADQGLDGTGKSLGAYRITSNAPIVAYQFNPLDNVDVFSNDASLLIPRSGFDKRYIGVSYPTLTRRGPQTAGRDNYNGYLAVVAWHDDTQISVTATATTVAGRDGTLPIAAGATQTFTLRAFEVLNLEAAAGPDPISDGGLNGGDLTGTLIQGVNGRTFGVFGGHEAVQITAPDSSCCADHLEEMLFPTSTWGKEFVVGRTTPRRGAPDILRIVAQTAGTTVAISPPPSGGGCSVLAAGAHCDVRILESTQITASQPVTVAHFMMSAILGMAGTGDPSMSIVPPVEQHRTDYKFLAPMKYDNQYVTIIAKAADSVALDGAPVTGFQAFGAGRAVATVGLTIGTHRVTCPLGCGVEVYGWSAAVSYMFAGGLDLHPIVIE